MDAAQVCALVFSDSSSVDSFTSEHLGLLDEGVDSQEVEAILPSDVSAKPTVTFTTSQVHDLVCDSSFDESQFLSDESPSESDSDFDLSDLEAEAHSADDVDMLQFTFDGDSDGHDSPAEVAHSAQDSPVEVAENYVDGTEFMSLTDDEIKAIVSPIGLVKKILKLRQSNTTVSVSTPSVASSSEDTATGSSSTPVMPNDSVDVPSHWRPEVEECIKKCCLSDSARSEVVRVLVTQLFAQSRKPSRVDCEQHARKLILKYPFMKDDMGNGGTSEQQPSLGTIILAFVQVDPLEQSWVDKMITRVRNVVKRDKTRSSDSTSGLPEAKRKTPSLTKGKDLLLRRYPVGLEVTVEDRDSLEQHKKAISDELDKSKPRDTVLLPLLKATYYERRLFVQSEATSVKQIIEKYPALARRAIIDQEMKMIIGKDVKPLFFAEWQKYVPAIIEYAKKSGKRNLCSKTFELDTDDDDAVDATVEEVVALKVITQALVYKADVLPYIYETYETESMEEVYRKPPLRNSPRIAVFVNQAGSSQYFIVCEQFTLCEAPNFRSALFYMFSAYYVFNLEYPKPAQTVFFFLQDYILSFPDSLKRPSSLAVLSDIKRNL